MRRTRLWDCRLGVGWSRVRVSGSSNSAAMEWGCAGVRPDVTIWYIADSPGSTARLRRCFRYSSNHPPTRNYARGRLSRICVSARDDAKHRQKPQTRWARDPDRIAWRRRQRADQIAAQDDRRAGAQKDGGGRAAVARDQKQFPRSPRRNTLPGELIR